jgi:hypothetical protein
MFVLLSARINKSKELLERNLGTAHLEQSGFLFALVLSQHSQLGLDVGFR